MGITRWGIISTANNSRLVLEGARSADGVEVVAVASRDEARAQSYAREHGIDRAHGSYEALLADGEVDAVYIPLPNSLHHEWTLRAARSGQARLVRVGAAPTRPRGRSWPGAYDRGALRLGVA
jgi:xylose dehydrogenase (NAD/NADP)